MFNTNTRSNIHKAVTLLFLIALSGTGFAQEDCLPFFDDKNDTVSVKVGGNVDITPSPPAIDDFGNDINKVCGASGKKTSEAEFIKLMKDNKDILDELIKFTDGKVFYSEPKTTDRDKYLESLSKAWYSIHAFDHIFCGETETDNKKIGGLHYYGRYKQLQDSGEACRIPNYNKNEVISGSVYSMGVRMKKDSQTWISHEIKGYGLTLSALDILKAATRAFAENPTSSADSQACLLDVKDGDVKYTTVFVRRNGGIRTFYPDATPDNTTKCKSTVNLNVSH
ncbi:EndoU domain-containing protein [Aeromonas veronii]